MDRAKQREIASKGGKAAHQKGTAHEWTSEEARDAGRKGGIASHQRRREQMSGSEQPTERTAPSRCLAGVDAVGVDVYARPSRRHHEEFVIGGTKERSCFRPRAERSDSPFPAFFASSTPASCSYARRALTTSTRACPAIPVPRSRSAIPGSAARRAAPGRSDRTSPGARRRTRSR